MSNLKDLLDGSDRVIGENGSIVHSVSEVNNNLLCLFIKLVRGTNIANLENIIKEYAENDQNAITNLIIIWYQTRATRGMGKGEKKIFYDMIPFLVKYIGIEPIIATIHLIPHYGYFKDYCYILEMNINEDLNKKIIELFTKQLKIDFDNMQQGKNISLAAKFAPSEKTRFHNWARIFANEIFSDQCFKQYRHMKTTLNKYLKTPEIMMAAKYNYNKLYASQLYPHNIIHDILCCDTKEKSIFIKQWEEMKKCLENSGVHINNAIPIVDVSESMFGEPMEAAIGLGILISEISTFKNRIITLDTKPEWIIFQKYMDITAKINHIKKAKSGGNTNFSAVIELILEHIEKYNLHIDEVPQTLFIFSDMQFDIGNYKTNKTYHPWLTHLEILRMRFHEVGIKICGKPYTIPQIIFWNVKGNTNGFQSTENSCQVQELSGFCPHILKYITANNPSETLNMILSDDNFLPIKYALSTMNYEKIEDDFVII
tara:strand:+ start:1447 stop:2901 length:1455 start_codon:yes stop_codon:yes gene_type:complete